jgi:ribonuclease P protein component
MAADIRPHSLPRGRRMQLPGEFSRVRAEGRRLVHGCLIMNWAESKAPSSRLGVVTSGKLGPAVERNRARRLMRECFRRHQRALMQKVDIVLIARNSINGRGLRDVEQDYLVALKRAGLTGAQA